MLADPPTGIAATRGAIWVAGSSASSASVTVQRIDPQFDAIDPGMVRIANVAPGTPGSIAAHGDAVWVAPHSGVLTRLAARSGRVVDRVDPNAAPTSVAVGAGAVWLTDSDADNVIRVDSTGLLTPVAVGHDPNGIAVGDGWRLGRRDR